MLRCTSGNDTPEVLRRHGGGGVFALSDAPFGTSGTLLIIFD
jgi:hypothetical protein